MDKTCLPSCPCSKWRKEDDVDEMQQVPPMESQALISGTLAPDSGKVTYRPRSSIVEDFISVDTCLSKCSQFGRGNLIPGMFVAKKGIIARVIGVGKSECQDVLWMHILSESGASYWTLPDEYDKFHPIDERVQI